MTGILGTTVASLALVVATVPVSTASETPSPSGPSSPSIHSSDGLAGPVAEPVPAARLQQVRISNEQSFQVVPGLRYRKWDQRDARGTIRAYLLRANLRRPGLSLEYTGTNQVAGRDELTDMLRTDKGASAVAGVNGDFFDIGDTGAPRGVGIDASSVLHGPAQGWMKSFVLPAQGQASVGELPLQATVESLPDLRITNVNSPTVITHGIGVYTSRWGTAPGYAVTDGARPADVRQVVIQDGVVVSNTVEVTTGTPIVGRVLIGRGHGAVRLNQMLPVGTPARVVVSAKDRPQLAISGSEILLQNGRIQTTDDGELHPRTAVGVDTDTGRILLVVIDGRQDFSRGYTMLELARLMKSLGAEEALNLDGGGSSTMVTMRPTGRTRVANSPSDGQERQVPNGLALVYRAP
jgi:hypothetical protein